MRQIWWNGKILPESEARISIYDSSFMFGDTVFEMTRSFNKVHFKLREHLERLMKSARYVRIPVPYTIEELEDACHKITEINKPEFAYDDEYRLMIDVTRGLLPRYESVGSLGTNVIISIFPLRWATKGLGKYFDTGINCVIPSQRQIPAQHLDPKIKHRSRLHFRMALNETDWPILLDSDGFITEGPGYNFFIVKDDILITPEPRNILRGISRNFAIELWQKYPINGEVKESNIEPYDVYEADEIFITATPFCMLPVTSLNGMPIGGKFVGKRFNDLLLEWSIRVFPATSYSDIKQQIQQWDERIGVPEYRTFLPLQ